MAVIDEALVDRVATRYPSPIADAVIALVSAESPHERRDRIVESFRAILRYLSAVALCARLTRAPASEEKDVRGLVEMLRRHALTDGQWWHMLRELVRPWKDRAKEHPVPALVELVARSSFTKDLDALLGMRKNETVAHGTTGDRESVNDIVDEREPVLARLLDVAEALHASARLVVPLPPADGPQQALALVGATPARGRHRRISLADGVRLEPGRCILIDPAGLPVVTLEPIVRHAAPSPGAIAEVFFLDGRTGRGAARYLSLPSANERVEGSVWDQLDSAFAAKGDDGAESVTAPRPYRGLARFESGDAELFFGRDDEIQALANRIRTHGIVTVTGPSGSGKSSLLAAGVVPALVASAGSSYRDAARRSARVFVCRPGRDPLRELARAVDLDGTATAAEITTRLQPAEGTVSVLIIDQAEELLTLAPREAALQAAALFASLGASDSAGMRVVLSIREDFFAQLARLTPLVGVYDRQVMVLGPLDREAMLRTLVEPARRFGVEFEAGLAESMVDALADRPGALPLLQFTADQMWERRGARVVLTRGVLDEIGGVEGALARHADATLDAMVPSQREVARQVMLRLVTPEGTRSTLRRDELETVAVEAATVVASLESARLLTARQDGEGHAVCELVHEALLAHWPRLAEWRHAEGEGASHVAQLGEAARAWRRGGKKRDQLWRGDVLAEHRRWRDRANLQLTTEERAFVDASIGHERKVRRNRFAIIAVVVLALSAIAVVAVVAWRGAAAAEKRAREALAHAETQALLVRAHQYAATGHTAEEMAVLRVLASRGDKARDLAVGEGFIWKAHQRLARVLGRDAGVTALSADGSRFVASVPGAIVVWDRITGKELARLKVPGEKAIEFPQLAAFSPMARYAIVATCAGTGACAVENLMGRPETPAEKPEMLGGLTPAPTDEFELRELASGAKLLSWDHDHPLEVGNIAFASDDSAIAVRQGGTVEVLVGTERHKVDVSCKGPIAVSSGGRVVSAPCDDGSIQLVRAGAPAMSLTADNGHHWHGTAFLDDHRLLASGDVFAMWNVDDGKRIGAGRMPEAPTMHSAPKLDWKLEGAGRTVVTDTTIEILGRLRTVTLGSVQVRGNATVVQLPFAPAIWAPLVIHGNVVSLGPTNDQLPPIVGSLNGVHCIPLMGRGDRGIVALDGGSRLLIDEQEVPAHVETSTDFGQQTTDEIPIRQWRPLEALDHAGCEVWEPMLAEAVTAEKTGIDVDAVEDNGHGVRHRGDRVTILDVRTGATLREVAAPEVRRRPYWVLDDIAAVPLDSSVMFVPANPAAPVVEIDDPSEFHGIGGTQLVWLSDDKGVSVFRVTDGTRVAQYPDPDHDIAGFLRDGTVVRVGTGGLTLTSPQGAARKLPRSEEITESSYDFSDQLLVATGKHVLVWNITSGELLGDLGEAHGAEIVGGEVWVIPDNAPSTIRRWNVATHASRDVVLSETSLPYHEPAALHASSDGQLVYGTYNIINDTFNSSALWDATTGALLWLGAGDAQLFSEGLVCDGRAFHPDFDVDHLLASTGARTNLRVCPGDYRAVPVDPPPAPDTVWAPPAACAKK